MSCRIKALSVSSLLILLRIQSISWTHAQPPSPSDYDIPEIDGSAVDDTCKIFTNPETSTATESTAPPITTKATTENPAVPTPQRRPQPNPQDPIHNSQSELAARLLNYLLANSRGHGAKSLNVFFSQPTGRRPYHGYGVKSDSDEFPPNSNRWKTGWFSSESSDES